jgi:hypothetical protein
MLRGGTHAPPPPAPVEERVHFVEPVDGSNALVEGQSDAGPEPETDESAS